MNRFTPVYAPDGMMSAGQCADPFDDGLVHNHHWAVTADEAYPSLSHGPAIDHGRNRVRFEASFWQSHAGSAAAYDRHDDGLVHNHEWAVTGK